MAAQDPRAIKPPSRRTPGRVVDLIRDANTERTYLIARDLERDKIESAEFEANGASEGDILVYIGGDWFPARYLPLGVGIGTSGDPTYRFQFLEGELGAHLTESASGGAHGLFLSTSSSSGAGRLALLWVVDDAVVWELGVNPQTGALALRDSSRNVLSVDSSGNISLVAGLTASGAAHFLGTLRAGPTTVSTLVSTGDAHLQSSVRTGDLVANSLETTGSAYLPGGLTAGDLIANSVATSGNLAASGDFAHSGTLASFYGVPQVPRSDPYTVSNDSETRTLDVSTVSLSGLANFVATMYRDLNGFGPLG